MSPSNGSNLGGGAANGQNYIEHQVSKMDTLVGVAIKYGVEVADIKRLNGLATNLQMFALKMLQIPLPGRHPPSPCLSDGASSSRKGLLKKVESLVDHAEELNRSVASVDAWFCLARGYLEGNQKPNPAEAMKKAISTCPPEWKPGEEIQATCVEYLEGIRNVEGAEKFLKAIERQEVFFLKLLTTVMNYIKGEK